MLIKGPTDPVLRGGGTEYIHLKQGFQFRFTIIIMIDYFWGQVSNLGEKFRQTCFFGNILSVNFGRFKMTRLKNSS